MTIDDYLLGHWHNRQQAQSNPHCFSQCEIIWEKEGDFFVSKNFYRSQEHNPYRHKRHKWVQTSATTGIMQNYRLDLTRHEAVSYTHLRSPRDSGQSRMPSSA